VCAESAPAIHNLLNDDNKPQIWDTLAEALSDDLDREEITEGLARKYVDRCVLVTEEQIADAMRFMLDEQGWLTEGGGVVTVGAIRSGVVPEYGRPTVCLASGANVDLETIERILGR